VNEALAHKSLTDGVGLFPAMFQHQPAACLQVRRRLANNDVERFQPGFARDQRDGRFMASNLGGEVGIVLPDVGRIGRDQRKALSGERREPTTL
jgi:hypothetical protein